MAGRGVVAAVGLLASIACSSPGDDLTVLYTADAQGYLKECACETGGELGGIARRATLVDSLRADAPNALLVEAGDFSTSPGPRGEITALVALRAMKEMDYDAVLPGEVDLNLGSAFWKKTVELGLPLVHTNFGSPEIGPPQRKPLIVEKDGERIAILGLLGSDLYLLPGPKESLEIIPPVAAAKAAGASAEKEGAESNLAHVHNKAPQIDALAKAAPQIDVLVAGHTTKNAAEPERLGSTLLVTAGFLGQHVGELRLGGDDPARAQNQLHRIETTIAEQPRIARWVGIAAPPS